MINRNPETRIAPTAAQLAVGLAKHLMWSQEEPIVKYIQPQADYVGRDLRKFIETSSLSELEQDPRTARFAKMVEYSYVEGNFVPGGIREIGEIRKGVVAGIQYDRWQNDRWVREDENRRREFRDGLIASDHTISVLPRPRGIYPQKFIQDLTIGMGW